MESSTGVLGAMLFASTHDSDGNLIPDFAEPAIRRPGIDVDLAVTAVDGLTAQISIEYQASDPNAVESDLTGEIPQYSPAPEGIARLWIWHSNSTPHDPRPITEGGDYIPPGVYSLAQLGVFSGHTRFTLEAVGPSTTVGDIQLKATLLPNALSDTVRASAFATGLFEVDSGGNYTQVRYPQISTPAPEFRNTSITLTNVRASANGQDVIADLTVSGSVDDSALDLIDGSEGTIESGTILLNGKPISIGGVAQSTVFPIQSAKLSEPGSDHLKPYDWTGSFSLLYSGVSVQPGANIVELVVRDGYGSFGAARQGMEVVVTSPPDVELSIGLDFSSVGVNPRLFPNLDAVVHIIRDGQLVTPPGGIVLHSAIAGVFRSADGAVTIDIRDLTEVIAVTPVWDDVIPGTISITGPDWCVSSAPIDLLRLSPNAQVYTGDTFVDEDSEGAWACSTIDPVAHALGPIALTGPGAIYPVSPGLLGPAQGQLGPVLFPDGEGGTREYGFVYGDVNGTPVALLSIDALSPRYMLLMQRAFDDAWAEAALLEGNWSAFQGYLVGYYDSGVSLIDGLKQLGRGGLYFVKNYNMFSIGWRFSIGESVVLREDQIRIAAARAAVEALADIVLRLREEADLFESAMYGDIEAANELGEQYSAALSAAAEILVAADLAVSEMVAFDQGVVFGRIGGELSSLIISLAGAEIAKAELIPRLITKVRTIPALASSSTFASAAAKIEAAANEAAAIAQRVGAGENGVTALRSLLRKVGDNKTWKTASREFLEETNDVFRRAKFDPELRNICDEIFTRMAAEATLPDGSVDLSKFTTYKDLDTWLMGRRFFGQGSVLNTNAHHLVRQDLARAFFPGITKAERGFMPAVLMPVAEHGQFERILFTRLRPGKYLPSDRDRILMELENAYSAADRPELFPLARQWLMGSTP